jgi:drug/metabolite transporter (DMT)-like permease
MGPERHNCTTFLLVRPVYHRYNPFLYLPCMQDNYPTHDARRRSRHKRPRLNRDFQCPGIEVHLPPCFGTLIDTTLLWDSTSNYSLKFVDASFYQVARGLVLPFTILTSYIMLQTRPSFRILLSCSVVTSGFFTGVFLDGTQVSSLGIFFGASSSLLSALHAAVMKRGFEVVDGSALSMSWYSNLLSSVLLIPFIIILGEGPAVFDLLSGRAEGFWTFVIGSVVTVSAVQLIVRRALPENPRFPRAVSAFCSPLRVFFQFKLHPRLRT